MWSTTDIKADIAETYRDAAVSGADMRRVADALEEIRKAVQNRDQPGRAWEMIADRIGLAFGLPEQAALLELRQRLIMQVVSSQLDRIGALLATDRTAGTQAWLTFIADAVGDADDDICERFAAVKLNHACALHEVVALVNATLPSIRQRRWPEVERLYRTLGDLAFVPATSRARLFAEAGLIHLFYFTGGGRSAELIDRGNSLAPDNLSVLCARGQARLEDDIDAASALAHLAIEAAPSRAAGYCLLGDCALRSRNPDTAEKHYRSGLRAQPGSVSPYLRLIHLFGQPRENYDLDQIPDLAARGSIVDPSSEPEILETAAAAFQNRGDTKEALSWYDRAIARFPDYLEAHAGKGYLRLDGGDTHAAHQIFRHLAASAPDAYHGYWGLALIAHEAEDHEEAERLYRAGAAHSVPWRHRFQALAAQMAWLRNHSDDAAEELVAVVAESTYDDLVIDAAERVADEMNRGGDTVRAVAFCGRIYEAAGPRYQARYQAKLGDIHAAADEHMNARRCYLSAVEHDPGNPVYSTKLARTLRLLEDWEGSRTIDELSLPRVLADQSFRREMTLLRNAEANKLFEAGQYSEAIPLYKAAIRYSPSDEVLHSNLADAWENDRSVEPSTRLDRAVEALDYVVSLVPENAEYARRRDLLSKLRGFARHYGSAFGLMPLVTPIAMEVAADLAPLMEGVGGVLTPEFARDAQTMRDYFWQAYGVRVPSIRVRGNTSDLSDGLYIIMLNEVPLVAGTIFRTKRFALVSPERLRSLGIEGDRAINPVTLDDGAWIAEPDWPIAERAGIELWHAMEHTFQHLRAVVGQNLADFCGHQEVKNRLEESGSDAAQTLLMRPETLTPLTAVMRGLLCERVPVTLFDTICARFLVLLEAGNTPNTIVEYLRFLPEMRDLLPGNELGTQHFAFDGAVERLLANCVHRDGDRVLLAMPPNDCQDALSAIRAAVGDCRRAALVVEDAELRPLVRKLVELEFPTVPVLARREVARESAAGLEAGTVRLQAKASQ